MRYLSSIDMCARHELENELKYFFVRLRHIRRRLDRDGATLKLNRLQRNRCRENLLALEQIEQDFYALTYPDDLTHLYRKLHRYVKLDPESLMDVFGREQVGRRTLFVAL